jgi:hypothetical protein
MGVPAYLRVSHRAKDLGSMPPLPGCYVVEPQARRSSVINNLNGVRIVHMNMMLA